MRTGCLVSVSKLNYSTGYQRKRGQPLGNYQGKANGQRYNWLVFDSDHPDYAWIESYMEFERFP